MGLVGSSKDLEAFNKDLVVSNNQLNSMPLDFHVRSFAATGSVVNIYAVRPSRTPSLDSSSPPIIEVQIEVFSFRKQTVIYSSLKQYLCSTNIILKCVMYLICYILNLCKMQNKFITKFN